MNKYTKEVNPFIGIDNQGNCLIGPYRPLGMVRPGPDTLVEETSHTNGYKSGLPIVRFTQVHVSGTGGGGRYGNIGISPYIGELNFAYPHHQAADEISTPGYYAVRLNPAGIYTELTCTDRTSRYRITYPQNSQTHLLIDVGATLKNGGEVIDGNIEVSGNHELVGRVKLQGGWGHNQPFEIFFSIVFNKNWQKNDP